MKLGRWLWRITNYTLLFKSLRAVFFPLMLCLFDPKLLNGSVERSAGLRAMGMEWGQWKSIWWAPPVSSSMEELWKDKWDEWRQWRREDQGWTLCCCFFMFICGSRPWGALLSFCLFILWLNFMLIVRCFRLLLPETLTLLYVKNKRLQKCKNFKLNYLTNPHEFPAPTISLSNNLANEIIVLSATNKKF